MMLCNAANCPISFALAVFSTTALPDESSPSASAISTSRTSVTSSFHHLVLSSFLFLHHLGCGFALPVSLTFLAGFLSAALMNPSFALFDHAGLSLSSLALVFWFIGVLVVSGFDHLLQVLQENSPCSIPVLLHQFLQRSPKTGPCCHFFLLQFGLHLFIFYWVIHSQLLGKTFRQSGFSFPVLRCDGALGGRLRSNSSDAFTCVCVCVCVLYSCLFTFSVVI